MGALAELALLPDTGLDLAELLSGNGCDKPDTAAYWVYRLDAASMLALPCTSETPDPHLGPAMVARLLEVRERLLREWAGEVARAASEFLIRQSVPHRPDHRITI